MAVLPGYNYLGPFNPLDSGNPTNDTDAAARQHDLAYNQLLKKGHNPYLKWSYADEDFVKNISNNTDYGAYIARGAFGAKRLLTGALGLSKIPKGIWQTFSEVYLL